MAYEAFKDLPERTTSDRLMRDKAFNIAKKQDMLDIRNI